MPLCRSAQRCRSGGRRRVSVLCSRQAMVIGPTPPGTGVIAPATSTASAKSTSPTSRVLPSPLDAVDADVDHRGARLDPVAADHPRPADGGDKDVGPAADPGRSRVREWAMVTVQSRRSSSCAIGLPTMLERPTTTARRPVEVAERVAQQHQAAQRRAGHQAGRPRASRPALSTGSRRRPWPDRWRRSPRAGSICGGSGSCTRMPWTADRR